MARKMEKKKKCKDKIDSYQVIILGKYCLILFIVLTERTPQILQIISKLLDVKLPVKLVISLDVCLL